MATFTPDYSDRELDYSITKNNVTNSSVDFIITGYSKTWYEFDITFEYRLYEDGEWKSDAILSCDNIQNIKKNTIYNLKASSSGTENTFSWNYGQNNITFGQIPHIRTNYLPRIRQYNNVNGEYIETYILPNGKTKIGQTLPSLYGLCYGRDWDGNYMRGDGTYFRVYSDLYSSAIKNSNNTWNTIRYGAAHPDKYYLVSYSALGGWSGLYIFNSSLGGYIKGFYPLSTWCSGVNAAYANYIDAINIVGNRKFLLTFAGDKVVHEMSITAWTVSGSISSLWKYPGKLTNPLSANYSISDPNKVIICDRDLSNNITNIIICDKNDSRNNIILDVTSFKYRGQTKDISTVKKVLYINKDNLAIIEGQNGTI
jgi:hypothetical protein